MLAWEEGGGGGREEVARRREERGGRSVGVSGSDSAPPLVRAPAKSPCDPAMSSQRGGMAHRVSDSPSASSPSQATRPAFPAIPQRGAISAGLMDALDATQLAFYCLAFDVLPMWDRMLQAGTFNRAEIKGWSHLGETKKYGDVGNRSMSMTLNLCFSIRRSLGASSLWELERRNMEHASDQLEAIMGLRELDPAWRPFGDFADCCCTKTWEAWDGSETWSVVTLRDVLGLDDLVRQVEECRTPSCVQAASARAWRCIA